MGFSMQILHFPMHWLHPIHTSAGEMISFFKKSTLKSDTYVLSSYGILLALLISVQYQGGSDHEKTGNNRYSGSITAHCSGSPYASPCTERKRWRWRDGWPGCTDPNPDTDSHAAADPHRIGNRSFDGFGSYNRNREYLWTG
jgi:hypothetical protein